MRIKSFITEKRFLQNLVAKTIQLTGKKSWVKQ